MSRLLSAVLLTASISATAGYLAGHGRPARAERSAPPAQSLTIHYPDPGAPGGRVSRTLRVATVADESHPVDVSLIRADDWTVIFHADETPGRGGSYYYARPITE